MLPADSDPLPVQGAAVTDRTEAVKAYLLDLQDRICSTLQAEDGQAALTKLRSGKFDFVVCDINMPNVNGLQMLAEVKKDANLKHIPVLMVTAEARKEDIVLAAQSGAAGYIVKPFTKATLEEKLANIFKKLGL